MESGTGAATVSSGTTVPPRSLKTCIGSNTVAVPNVSSLSVALMASTGARKGVTTYRYTAIRLMSTATGTSVSSPVAAVTHSDLKFAKRRLYELFLNDRCRRIRSVSCPVWSCLLLLLRRRCLCLLVVCRRLRIRVMDRVVRRNVRELILRRRCRTLVLKLRFRLLMVDLICLTLLMILRIRLLRLTVLFKLWFRCIHYCLWLYVVMRRRRLQVLIL